MNIRDQLARIEARAKRSAERGNERHHEIDERFRTIEANTARIDKLEKQMAAVLAALPKIKGV